MNKPIHNDKGLSRLETDLEQFLKREEAKLERTHKSYSGGKPPDRGKNFFKDTRLGRFLSGRTRKGRVVRRIGLASLGLGGINLVGLGPEINQLTSEAETLAEQFNELILLLGALLTTLSHIIDKLEHYDTVSEEREKAEGKIPAIKKVLRSISKQKEQQHKRE
ncbi:MAG: hypothetical protein JJ971_02660 [Balneolaceae bacterium]|nr:hypothetical protein [Balneolaceae bacterium]MBO6545271.1 hypothetical protein [Balneolaceae bacterium]MBO6646667.1 hypothetical protein [Balneolaceae bacterium]